MGETSSETAKRQTTVARFRAPRLPLIDAARGVALVAMVVYHLSWDLRYFGFITSDVEGELGWVIFARSIAASFLFIVGVSLFLSTRKGIDWRRYLRRLGVVAVSAAAITVVTWFVFRETFIFFGILHLIAVASVLGLAFVRAPAPVTLATAASAIAAPSLLSGPVFDTPALIWLGLSTEVPRTNDFVPIFPWFGAVLAGIGVAQLWPWLGLDRLSLWQSIRVPPALLLVGRHTLLIYLLHQPILFGLVDLAAWLKPPDLLGFEPAYLESCVAFCAESEPDAAMCQSTCQCVADRSQEEGLWRGLMRQSLSEAQEVRYFTLVDECRAAAETQ